MGFSAIPSKNYSSPLGSTHFLRHLRYRGLTPAHSQRRCNTWRYGFMSLDIILFSNYPRWCWQSILLACSRWSNSTKNYAISLFFRDIALSLETFWLTRIKNHFLILLLITNAISFKCMHSEKIRFFLHISNHCQQKFTLLKCTRLGDILLSLFGKYSWCINYHLCLFLK